MHLNSLGTKIQFKDYCCTLEGKQEKSCPNKEKITHSEKQKNSWLRKYIDGEVEGFECTQIEQATSFNKYLCFRVFPNVKGYILGHI